MGLRDCYMAFMLRNSITRGLHCSSFSASEVVLTRRPLLVVSSSRFCSSASKASRPQLIESATPAHQTRYLSNTNNKMDQDVARKQSVDGKNNWKTRPPYSIHDKDFNALYEASCHCGKVQYQLSRQEPLDSKLCHCTTCQTQHAAPFQWAAIFHKDDISFKEGHHNLEWYDPSKKSIEHKLPCKVRCSYCHSPIMDEGRNMILLFPSLIHFPDNKTKLNFKPR